MLLKLMVVVNSREVLRMHFYRSCFGLPGSVGQARPQTNSLEEITPAQQPAPLRRRNHGKHVPVHREGFKMSLTEFQTFPTVRS